VIVTHWHIALAGKHAARFRGVRLGDVDESRCGCRFTLMKNSHSAAARVAVALLSWRN
jgi:hypothetical protein